MILNQYISFFLTILLPQYHPCIKTLIVLQAKTKVEESAPGAATGMILSLRERYITFHVRAFEPMILC